MHTSELDGSEIDVSQKLQYVNVTLECETRWTSTSLQWVETSVSLASLPGMYKRAKYLKAEYIFWVALSGGVCSNLTSVV